MTLPIDDRVGLDAARRRQLEAALAPLGNLQDVVRWGLAERPARVVGDVIPQDEYTHDVLLPWRDGLVLVFDAT